LIAAGACAAAFSAGIAGLVSAQQGPPAQRGRRTAVNVFNAADADKDGFVTREEFARSAGDSASRDQLAAAITASFPAAAPPPPNG